MNFRISGQKIKIFWKTKKLGLDEKLTFKSHLDNENFKLNRANYLLIKIRYYVKPLLLHTVGYIMQSLTHIWDMAAKFGVKPKAKL